MPCWARRVVSVAPIMVKVKPEETPRNRAASGADSRYGRNPAGNAGNTLAQRVVIVDGEGRVVGEPLVLVDRCALCGRRELRRRDLVIDAPTHVVGVRLAAVTP